MATETLRPNAAGDECSINDETGAACPNHYQNVDEAIADETTTSVYNDGVEAYQRDLYHIDASGLSDETINKITVYFRCQADDTESKAKASIKSNSTVTDGAEKSFAEVSTWYNFSQEWATNPADSQAWEVADLADLQIGISLYAASSRDVSQCTQVYVVVDYTAVITGIGAFYQRRNPFGLNIQTAGQVRTG